MPPPLIDVSMRPPSTIGYDPRMSGVMREQIPAAGPPHGRLTMPMMAGAAGGPVPTSSMHSRSSEAPQVLHRHVLPSTEPRSITVRSSAAPMQPPHEAIPMQYSRSQPSHTPDDKSASGAARSTSTHTPTDFSPEIISSSPALGSAMKRKQEGELGSPHMDAKRAKIYEVNSTEDGAPGHGEIIRPPKKTISFEEVYRDGKAEQKHAIVDYPPGKGDYYILKCDEHGVHFNANPLAGAAKHLHSIQHGNQTKERSKAVELLGYRVIDCDAAKAKLNNDAFNEALQQGYKPMNLNQLTKSARQSMGLDLTGTPSSQKTSPVASHTISVSTPSSQIVAQDPAGLSRPFPGIVDPSPGELYLAYWVPDKKLYAVILLPWGDLGRAGMRGTLASSGLMTKPPKCYVVDRITNEIKGWATGFENGGPYERRREFPVMYFDGKRYVFTIAAAAAAATATYLPN